MRLIVSFLVIALVLFSAQFASAFVSCSDIWVDTDNIAIESNDSDYFFFKAYNDSDERFSVLDAKAWRESGNYEISMWDYPAWIEADDDGWLTIKVDADAVSSETTGEAYVQLRGEFEGGKYCGFGSIGDFYFDVTIERDSGTEPACGELDIRASNVYIDEGQAKTVVFRIENNSDDDFELYDIGLEESSSYFNATLYRKPGLIAAGESGEFKVRIEAESVTRDVQANVTVQARGRFDNGRYCGYSDIAEEEFTVFVENVSVTIPKPPFGGCRDIYLNASTVRVDIGTTAYATIYLENDTDEDFLIDYVSVFDSSSNIQAEENGYGKVIAAFDSSYINVKVKAYGYAATGEEEAFVEVKGHFQGENACYLFGGGIAVFPVIVEEPEPIEPAPTPDFSGCTYFSLIAPEARTIENSGTIPITIDNRTMERATVRLYGPGLTVQPVLISVPKNTLISENISVSSALPETTLIYRIEALGCNQTRTTKIIATGIMPEQEGEEEQPEEEQQGIIDSISSGLFAIGQAGAVLGLAVLVVLALYLIFKPKSA